MTTANVFSCNFQVRDSELDSFGVVNHSRYLNYFEHARHELLAKVGLSAAKILSEGQALALSQLSLTYKHPLRSRDFFRVDTRICQLKGARMVFFQELYLADLLSAEALATGVWLDKKGKPLRLSETFHQLLQPFFLPTEKLPKMGRLVP